MSSDVRKGVGQRLAIVGDLLERHFGAAQVCAVGSSTAPL